MDKKRLVILSDYGLDDACATAFLLEHNFEFSSIDIVAIGGNTTSENSLNNAKKLLVEYARQNGAASLNSVRLVDSCKISQPFYELPKIHGDDGMGDLLSQTSPLPVAVLEFDEWLQTLDNSVILFSAGPCTITKIILQKIGACQLVIMAGVVNQVANYNGYEFNQGLDVDAFNFCVKYSHVIATLDSCRVSVFNMVDMAVNSYSLLASLVKKRITLDMARHKDNCFIYDLIAAQYLVYPDMFSQQIVVDKWGNKLNSLVAKNGSTHIIKI